MINQIKIPYFDFMSTKDNIIKFKIGKLKQSSNENFKYIHNVKIEISEKIVISFKDPESLIETQWPQYDFSKNQIDSQDYEFEYKGYSFLFKNLIFTKISSDYTRIAKADNIIIKKGKFDYESEVNVLELIDKSSLNNGTFEYDEFKINICKITNQKIKENYNAESGFYYECKYTEIEKWNEFNWKLYLMLRFYAGSLLFPQTKIITDSSNNFEIIFNGFESYGESKSIFNEGFNSFSNFLESSFEIFNKNYKIYNLLVSYWITLHNKSFVEIKNLSEFVFFEILVKYFSSLKKSEFSEKLYNVFDLQNFDLKFFNKLFFKEVMEEVEKIHKVFLIKYPNNPVLSDIFEFYEINFIIFYIMFYRNEIVHKGKINFNEDNLHKILNKICKKIENEYLNKHRLPQKTISDFKKYQNNENNYWKGFKKGFKIANEQKNSYTQEFNENIRPLIRDIHKKLHDHFKENSIKLMDPLEVFDRIMIIILIRLLKINCYLTNEPRFYINGKYIFKSEDYISNFLKKENK